MSEREQLLQAALDHPRDPARMQVLADWLDEHGEADLAHAWRWAARRGRWPWGSPRGRSVWWSTLLRGQHRAPWPHQLPRLVFDCFRPRAKADEVKCRDVPSAFRRLADTLMAMRKESAL